MAMTYTMIDTNSEFAVVTLPHLHPFTIEARLIDGIWCWAICFEREPLFYDLQERLGSYALN